MKVTKEWLIERGAKQQEFGGKFSFFGPRPSDEERSWMQSPLLWIDVDLEGHVSLALVDQDNSNKRYWLGHKTLEEIDQLLTLLGTVPYVAPKVESPQ